MNIQQAIQMIIADERENTDYDANVTDADIIYELQGSLRLAETGAYTNQVVDRGDELSQAYMLILATDERLEEMKKRAHLLTLKLTTARDEENEPAIKALTGLLKDVEAELIEIDRVRERHGL